MKFSHSFVLLAYGENPYLESCIVSILKQSIKSSEFFIYTSTPNDYILDIAKKYNVEVKINYNHIDINNDWNSGFNLASSDLVTLVLQEDIYDKYFLEKTLKYYDDNTLVSFTDYNEIRENKIVSNNRLLLVKKFLLFPLTIPLIKNTKFVKKLIISFGNPICTPSVTYNKKKINSKNIFLSEYKTAFDWEFYYIMSKRKGKFLYINEPLIYARIHKNQFSKESILDKSRYKEEFCMYKNIWPDFISRILVKLYSKGYEMEL